MSRPTVPLRAPREGVPAMSRPTVPRCRPEAASTLPAGARRPRKPKIVILDEAGRRPKKLAIPDRAIRRIAAAALARERVGSGTLSVLVTRDPKIRVLNRDFRGVDKATNVLSFPGVARVKGASVAEPHIGDIAISLDYVERQGAETGSGFRYTFAFYLVHGVLHLLGWDHRTAREEAAMHRRTREILEIAGES